MSLRLEVARRLEGGEWQSPPSRALSRVWARAARPARPARLPHGVFVIGVGGPTLGGSYKTPLALSLARALSRAGARVAIAAHGYGARSHRPLLVRPGAAARDVGDEALWMSRALPEIPVFSGTDRSETLSSAAGTADVVVADGLLQTAPVRLSLSVLVVDAAAPWGAASCPPAGDLRAPRQRLLAATDIVVSVTGAIAAPALPETEGRPLWVAGSEAPGAWADRAGGPGNDGALHGWSELRGLRVGLVLSIARPERVLGTLRANGVEPLAVRLHADHEPPPRAARAAVDVWLTTAKCRTKLEEAYAGAPVWTLAHEVSPPEALLAEIERRRFAQAPGGPPRV